MVQVAVIYYSVTGNTQSMAEAIAAGAAEVAETVCLPVGEMQVRDLPAYDAIVIGSPVYFGTCAGPVKNFIDETVQIRGKLEGRLGAAFTTSGARTGGKETTIFSILQAMLIHGMVVIGDPLETGWHYGIAADGGVNPEILEDATKYGRRIARVAEQLTK